LAKLIRWYLEEGRPFFFGPLNMVFSFQDSFFSKKMCPTFSQQRIFSCVIVYVPWNLLDLA
jgi:hypothetical protein